MTYKKLDVLFLGLLGGIIGGVVSGFALHFFFRGTPQSPNGPMAFSPAGISQEIATSQRTKPRELRRTPKFGALSIICRKETNEFCPDETLSKEQLIACLTKRIENLQKPCQEHLKTLESR